MARTLAPLADEIDRHVEAACEDAIAFLERLVAEPSVLGAEAGALDVAAAELAGLGFEVERLPIPADIGEDPAAGVMTTVAGPREVLVARRRGHAGATHRSLLLNGHLDVVPSGGDELWATAPFEPARLEGWLHGRGSGDMKGGWAMAVLALRALLATTDPAGDLTVVGVVEEECTGNGTLAAVRAGVLADAVLLPEPTELELLTAGVGVLWADAEVRGAPAHALDPSAGKSALDAAIDVVAALRRVAARLDAEHGPGRYHLNVGELRAGDWPSTVPGLARIRVRVGFPPAWTPDDAMAWLQDALQAELAGASWLEGHPPLLRPSGFRAAGYALPEGTALEAAVAGAHAEVFGAPPVSTGTTGTTDARFYLNEGGVPALCYGPRVRGMHAADERVELQSLVDGARVLARFMAGWLAAPRETA